MCILSSSLARATTSDDRYAAYLEDDIYELRFRLGRVNYRILYFFHGREAAVLSNALTKEDIIPRMELTRASECKSLFRANPLQYTYPVP